ncbi:MAG: polyamine aminopropyltransferase [Bacteroidales bacterium]|nr:polyamine aminopropyltransferase [Bacteroidales bacterium]
MESLGRHILVEFACCNPEVMNDVTGIEQAMIKAAEDAGATVINSNFHHFSPYGVSGVVVIQESHLAIHTWPEYQYASVDLFTCGDEVNPWHAFDQLKEVFQSKSYSVLELHRGSLNLLERIEFNAENYRKIAEDRVKKTKFKRSTWFTDKDENIALSLSTSGEVLYDQKSEFQRVRVMESNGFGKMLAIDNMVMCTEKDEFHYHEMISHPAIFAHGNPERVLVIGGGDGGTIREVLKHKSIKEVVMVEIDEKVVEASKLHLPQLSSEFENPKLDLRIADGIQYVKDAAAESFDLILVDGSDPVGPAEGLFNASFYQECKRVLKQDGILVTQGESPIFNHQVFVELNKCLKSVFNNNQVEVILFQIPTYPSGVWSFQLATKSGIDLKKINEELVEEFSMTNDLNYYNSSMHKAAYSLPNYVKKMLK